MLSFTCAMPGGVFLAGLACWLLSWKFIFLFSSSLFLGRVPRLLRLFSPGGRVVVSEAGLAVRVSLLAASLPLPMVFPCRWGHGVRLYLLGWFAILEVFVLKSRVSPFLMVSSLLAWCLEFWAPGPVAPLPRGALWFFVRYVEFACSTGHLASCVSLFARFRPACGLVFAALG